MSKKHIQLLIGIAVTVVALYFAFRDIDLKGLWEAFRRTNWWWALVVVACTVVSFLWRAVRWKILLQPVIDRECGGRDVSAMTLFGPLMIGFGFNNILPLRAGEFLRPLALKKQCGISYPAGFSTVILERLIDSIVLLALFATLPWYMHIDPDFSMTDPAFNITLNAAAIKSVSVKFSIIALVLMVGILSCLLPPLRAIYIRIIHALPLVPDSIKHKLEGLIESFAKGFESLKSPKALLLVLLHSVGVWVTIAFTYWFMSFGFPGVAMTFGGSLGMLAIICVAISFPSSPGFWGLFEFGGKFALIMMGGVEGGDPTLAVGFTMLVHFLQWAPITAIGLYYAARLQVSAAEATTAEVEAETVIEDIGKEAEREAEADA